MKKEKSRTGEKRGEMSRFKGESGRFLCAKVQVSPKNRKDGLKRKEIVGFQKEKCKKKMGKQL